MRTGAWFVVLTTYIYIALEWLFFFTKPSSLSSKPLPDQIQSLLVSPLALLLIAASLYFVCMLAWFLLKPLTRKSNILLVLPAAAIATVLTILLIDNFTLTVLDTGIRSTKDHQPIVWMIFIVVFFVCWVRWLYRKLNAASSVSRVQLAALPALSILTAVGFVAVNGIEKQVSVTATDVKHRPNIIFFASDGIQSSHVSLYGYGRDTTPVLQSISSNALVVHNTIANAGRTTGSVTAMLTGRYPTTTKVIFPPHTLDGTAVHQHLPAILNKLGYQSFQESVRYYADGPDLNMQEAFDHANGRAIAHTPQIVPRSLTIALDATIAFSKTLFNRVQDRALHLLGVRAMSNAFDVVNPENIAKVYGTTDDERLIRFRDFIEQSTAPVFAHIHLMGTHCCHYFPRKRTFSASHSIQTAQNILDFYDDAILNSDILFGRFLRILEQSGKLENTVVIYSSDHTREWRTHQSVPLLIRFPDGAHAGAKFGNNQLIDIAPTVLDYLDIPVPDWMEGHSLLLDPESKRDLFSIDSVNRKKVEARHQTLTQLIGAGPPRYGIRTVSLTRCRQTFRLDIETGEMTEELFQSSVEICDDRLDSAEAGKRLTEHLIQRGIDAANRVTPASL
ncbi:MAG: sulfatase-like hydrolase/transferase [Pseudomonadota bacterium]